MKAWILFFIGTLIYFLLRYNGRTDKTKEFNMKFWFQDNWPELTVTFLLDLLVMMILMDENTNIVGFLDSFLPIGIVVPAQLVIGASCGLGVGAGIYELFKNKLTKKRVELENKE